MPVRKPNETVVSSAADTDPHPDSTAAPDSNSDLAANESSALSELTAAMQESEDGGAADEVAVDAVADDPLPLKIANMNRSTVLEHISSWGIAVSYAGSYTDDQLKRYLARLWLAGARSEKPLPRLEQIDG